MIKILYVVSRIQKCGPVNQLSYIIRFLDRSRFSPCLVSLFQSPDEDFEREYLNHLNVPYSLMNASDRTPDSILTKRIRRALKDQSADVLHTTGLRPDRISARLSKEIATVASLRNSPFDDYVMAYGRFIGSFLAKVHLRALRRIGAPVACSQFVSGKVAKSLGKAPKIIDNGIDVDMYVAVDDTQKAAVREKLSLPGDSRVFVSAGLLIARKDPVILIDAFNAYHREHTNCELVVVGGGDMYNTCIDRAGEGVRFIGHTNDVLPYLQAADYFISSSLAEGLPNSVLEAISCGLPCVLSNIGPHIHIAERGDSGFVTFDTGDAVGLEHALCEITQRDYKIASADALSVASNSFSAERMSKAYQELYL